MQVLQFFGNSVNQRHIEAAADALREGALVIYPTDTHYAIGCDPSNRQAVQALVKFKGGDRGKDTLTLICGDISQASTLARIDNVTFRILKNNTPAPVTFLLNPAPHLLKNLKGRTTVGLRIPRQPVTVELAKALGSPILSASLPLDSEDASNPDAIALALSEAAAFLLDAGVTPAHSSTILDLTDPAEPVLVREGPVHPQL
ncbi:MAG: threonylcarbamoyl-AMP synthase [Muribaculaceae bacterium]|nr:threonylcarbamoyl-AMP synthase [Muribaculaceae bacterium]